MCALIRILLAPHAVKSGVVENRNSHRVLERGWFTSHPTPGDC